MPAYKNHSMLEDENLKEPYRTLKRLNIRKLDRAFPPIGHLYSVMVEELNIEEPNFQEFINDINKQLLDSGEGLVRIRNQNERLYAITVTAIRHFLYYFYPNIPADKYNKIINEAYGGYAY